MTHVFLNLVNDENDAEKEGKGGKSYTVEVYLPQ